MKTKTQKITMSALIAAIIFVVTRFIQVPMPAVGYVNLGDAFVILAGWMLPGWYGFLAAGIGSALADVLSGFVIYAPATFIVKGLMALLVWITFKSFGKNRNTIIKSIVAGLASEVVMIAGYLVYEGFLYGFKTAILSVPFNGIQGAVGLVVGAVLINAFSKSKIFK